MATNEFLPFSTSDSNVLTQTEYAADAQRVSGNIPGVARSKLVNKAARQAAAVSSMIGQFTANNSGQDALDNGDSAALLTNYQKAILKITPGRLLGITTYTTAGTFTFTPNPLAKSWRVIVTGAGGGSGGVTTTAAGESKASTGAGGGGTTIHNYTTVFTSASVVVGAGGSAGTAAPTNGGNGAISSFAPVGGVAISATGGSGSTGVSSAALMPSQQSGASGGVGAGGNLFPNIIGGNGGNAQFPRTGNGISGYGGSSYWSPGGGPVAGVNAAGNVGRFGSGAGGCIAQEAGNFQNGATGGAGVVYIEEYA